MHMVAFIRQLALVIHILVGSVHTFTGAKLATHEYTSISNDRYTSHRTNSVIQHLQATPT